MTIARRTLLMAGTAAWAATASGPAQAQTAERAPAGRRTISVVDLGADASGAADSAPAFQKAIDQLAATGGVLYVPTGTYRIGKTLEWLNPVNARRSGILFQGDGPHSSILKSVVRNGPLLRVRGVPVKGPVSTTFFWGGGIRDLTLDGNAGGADHDGLEVLGWWYGEIFDCRFVGFSRHAIRAIPDLEINPNPDFSASTLFVRATWFERCGGWGFIDEGPAQVTPAWAWDRCVFVMCKLGGALVKSSSHSFVKCSFALSGWQNENGAPASRAYGLYFDGAATATSRQWVEGCEFDNNLTGHIGARFLSSSSFINNRFIFNDRLKIGHLCPPAGVEIGPGDGAASVRTVEFRQNFFRFDRGGEAVGFQWTNTANVRDVMVDANLFSDGSGGSLKLTRYKGHDRPGAGTAFGYEIREREAPAGSVTR